MTDERLARFGFGFAKRSVHVARTIMLEDLTNLLVAVPEAKKQSDYLNAIIEDNCLGKKSLNTRKISAGQLVQLYTIDPEITIFRNLLYFWQRDEKGRPLLALLCAVTRDPVLRQTAQLIMDTSEGSVFTSESVEEYIGSLFLGRYSKVTLASMARNIRSTWTQTGHLSGRSIKKRVKPEATPGTVAYALLLSYLTGRRGTELFETEYVKILDCNREKAIEMAEQASVRGWIVFKRIGDVMEASFPNLLTEQEVLWLREQTETIGR
ncbi:MAG: hypothetical protein M1489_01580 [Firmicutes bacterium]|nr:hypothetical protein [Bacillota bacterium]